MPETKKTKKPVAKNLLLGFVTLALFVVVVFLIVGNLRIADKRNRINAELKALEKRMAELTQEKEVIQGKIFQSNNKDYLEWMAREVFGLKREGESVVAYYEDKAQEEREDPWWQALWQKIMTKVK